MTIKVLDCALSVMKISYPTQADLSREFTFFSRTDEELSLVCPTEYAPADALEREDNWRAFRIEGVLDFSLIGILSKIASVLAAEKIGIFAISTYNTDYILVKQENLDRAVQALRRNGYDFI